ncbi:MAG: glycoside hydrolase family 43 protein [Chitinispirillaceae bacterium]|nr:glycoside hydrolase family 43 protein [Chitinispirillaceae bacterium]
MKLLQIIRTFFIAVVLPSLCLAQTPVFENPIAEKRADPWIYKNDDGTYYLIATVPAYDRIVLRKANSINGLKYATEKVLWNKHRTGEMGSHIWAPELHKVDGKWYIYFAAGEAVDTWKIRMFVLSNQAQDPMVGTWTEEGRIVTRQDGFSLDATSFEHNGKRYLIWAQTRGDGTALLLSQMVSATKLTGPEVIITKPDLAWERKGHNVNEGPAVIKRNGKIFVTYSASATDFNYCMGLLWIDEKADLLSAKNWHKSPQPVFFTNEALKRYGPGHNSFTIAEDGKTDIMIYHARDYKNIKGDPLGDPNRHTRARVLLWKEDGFPDFMQDKGDEFVTPAKNRQPVDKRVSVCRLAISGKRLVIKSGFTLNSISVTDLAGKIVARHNNVNTMELFFNVSQFKPGLHVACMYGDKRIVYEKFMVH